jgi:hypothetical protein
MSPRRRRRLLVNVGLLFVAAFVVGAGGAAPRYNRIVYGGLPLVLALICFGAAAFLHRSNTGRRASVALGVGCWLLAIGVLATWIQPSLAGAARPEPRIERAHVLLTLQTDRVREALFSELQPVELSNCRFERFGAPRDGGYLMCGNLLAGARVGYSYGIDARDEWGCDISKKLDVRVHQYDCFDLTVPACSGGDTVFHPECIGPARRTDKEGRIFDTLEHQFRTNGDHANRVVLKMDVEGAEWASLLRTPDDVLERIDQFAVELHGIAQDHQLAVVRRLKQFFHVANVHYNNRGCAERIDPFPSTVYEVLFVNKRIAQAVGPRADGPNPLDAPNTMGLPDCQHRTSRWSHAIPGALRPAFLR